jgi:hypothetical protein
MFGGQHRRDAVNRTYGEPSAIVITQPKQTSAELLSKNTILFDQIGERFPLPAI